MQHTVSIEDVSVKSQVLRALAHHMRTQYPQHAARIGRAVALVEHGHVTQTPTAYHIRSQGSELVYTISRQHGCCCPDATKRKERGNSEPCKHAFAVWFFRQLTWSIPRTHYAAYVKNGVYIEGYAWPSRDFTYAWFIGEHQEAPTQCQACDIVLHGKVVID